MWFPFKSYQAFYISNHKTVNPCQLPKRVEEVDRVLRGWLRKQTAVEEILIYFFKKNTLTQMRDKKHIVDVLMNYIGVITPFINDLML